MTISLAKGQSINLAKEFNGLRNIHVGLGWDEAKVKGGFFKKVMSSVSSIDCDASVILLDANGKLQSKNDMIYFGNKRSSDGAIIHQGDNLTGKGDGDDEVINLNLDGISSNVHRIVFVVNIYQGRSRNQHFGMIDNAFIRIVDKGNGKELVRYNLTSEYANALTLYVGELIRTPQGWEFKATGEGTTEGGLGEIETRFR